MSCGCSALVVGRLATGGGAGVAVAGGVVESCGAGVVDGGVELDGVAVGGTATAVLSPELEKVLLGGDTGGILHRCTTAQQQAGEEKGSPPPRHGIPIYRGLTRKWARRFLAQHDSVCSVHCGRSSP